jgi:hypothetical protein
MFDVNEPPIEIGPEGMSLDLLQAVYRHPALPLGTRIRAAALAIQHETPRLLASAVITDHDIATLLDRRLERLAAIREGKFIEHQPQTEPVEVKPYKPNTPDRRWRRI